MEDGLGDEVESTEEGRHQAIPMTNGIFQYRTEKKVDKARMKGCHEQSASDRGGVAQPENTKISANQNRRFRAACRL